MKAAIINSFGKSENIIIMDNVSSPKVSSNQVLIKVNYTSVNQLDLKTRQGDLKPILGDNFPIILGNDVSGEIVECGEKVRNFKVGDFVYCMIDSNPKLSYFGFAKSGSYATYCTTRAETIALVPKNILLEEASTIPLCALTAYQALVIKARIKNGDKILINGASGGVGVYAIQIAKSFGANVTAVCSTKNIENVNKLGVDSVIDYTKTNILDIDDKFDIIFDVVANKSYKKIKKLLNRSGVFISNIAPVVVFLFPFLRKIRRFGKYTFAWVEPNGNDLATITELIEQNKIKPVVDTIFSLNNIAMAHNYLEQGKPFGKISIKVL